MIFIIASISVILLSSLFLIMIQPNSNEIESSKSIESINIQPKINQIKLIAENDSIDTLVFDDISKPVNFNPHRFGIWNIIRSGAERDLDIKIVQINDSAINVTIGFLPDNTEYEIEGTGVEVIKQSPIYNHSGESIDLEIIGYEDYIEIQNRTKKTGKEFKKDRWNKYYNDYNLGKKENKKRKKQKIPIEILEDKNRKLKIKNNKVKLDLDSNDIESFVVNYDPLETNYSFKIGWESIIITTKSHPSMNDRQFNSLVWINNHTGYIFYLAFESPYLNDLLYQKTTDGGISWGSVTNVSVGLSSIGISLWYDKWTSEQSGDLINLVYTNFNQAFIYNSLNTTSGLLGNPTNISTNDISGSSGWDKKMFSITKSRGGRLYAGGWLSNSNSAAGWYSDNNGNNWNGIKTFTESNSSVDRTILTPCNEANMSDICAVYWDVSSNEISLKVYNSTSDSWTESATKLDATDNLDYFMLNVIHRQSDNHTIIAFHNNKDVSTQDLKIYDISDKDTLTEKSDIFTNVAEPPNVAMIINQQNDDLYVSYSKGSTINSDVYYKKSTDGGSTWGSEVLYDDSSDDIKGVYAGTSVGNDGGRFQPVFFNDDLNNIYTNNSAGIHIPPIGINFIAPTPFSGVLVFDDILVNATFNTINSTIYLYNSSIDLINTTRNSTASPFFINFTGLDSGVYFFNASGSDKNNNDYTTDLYNIVLQNTNLTGNGTVKSSYKINESRFGNNNELDLDQFGITLANIGDLDGDGIQDIAVGEPLNDDGASSNGAVWIMFMNTNGSVKDSFKINESEFGNGNELAGDQFGFSVANIGDLDGDGIQDLAIGEYSNDDGVGDNNGAVWIMFMNTNGSVKDSFKINESEFGNGNELAGGFFGTSVTSLGDLDNDGVQDLAVGEYLNGDGGTANGAVWVLFLNQNGSVKDEFKINTTSIANGSELSGDRFGFSVANLGDLDNDGSIDLAVGDYLNDDGQINNGAVWVLFLNNNGSVKDDYKINESRFGNGDELDTDNFGISVASLGDLDGDGVQDLAIGEYGNDDGGSGNGAVWIMFLNTNGSVKNSFKINESEFGNGNELDGDRFGASLANLGDLDGDGVQDLAVGEHLNDDGGTDNGAFWIINLNQTTAADPAEDTCDCATINTNWNVSMSDSCVISSDCDIGSGNLTFYNTGNFSCAANISVSNMDDPPASSTIYMRNQCTLDVTKT